MANWHTESQNGAEFDGFVLGNEGKDVSNKH